MLFVTTGASGSGKSEYAERLVCRLAGRTTRKLYVATMAGDGREALSRIARHRAMRAGKGFETLEAPFGFLTGEADAAALLDRCAGGVVLLECMSNLLANLMFARGLSGEEAGAEIARQTVALLDRCAQLVVVTNEIFSDGVSYPKETEDYIRALARINRDLAGWADVFCEIVYTVPVVLKNQCEGLELP